MEYSKPEPRVPYYRADFGRPARVPLDDLNPPNRLLPRVLVGLAVSLVVWIGIEYGVSCVKSWLVVDAKPTEEFTDLRRQQLDQIRQLQQALSLAEHQNADLRTYNDELKKMLKAKNRAVIP